MRWHHVQSACVQSTDAFRSLCSELSQLVPALLQVQHDPLQLAEVVR